MLPPRALFITNAYEFNPQGYIKKIQIQFPNKNFLKYCEKKKIRPLLAFDTPDMWQKEDLLETEILYLPTGCDTFSVWWTQKWRGREYVVKSFRVLLPLEYKDETPLGVCFKMRTLPHIHTQNTIQPSVMYNYSLGTSTNFHYSLKKGIVILLFPKSTKITNFYDFMPWRIFQKGDWLVYSYKDIPGKHISIHINFILPEEIVFPSLTFEEIVSIIKDVHPILKKKPSR